MTVDHTNDIHNYYGLKGLTLENAVNTEYTLSIVKDGVTFFYAEDSNGSGYLSEGKATTNQFGRTAYTAPADAWKGDATEKYNVAVRGNVVFWENRTDKTETKTVNGEKLVFTQNTNFGLQPATMVAKGAELEDGYNLNSESKTLKWAWTMRYQSGWTLDSGIPTGLPYVEGHYPYGFEPGESNPVYDELWLDLHPELKEHEFDLAKAIEKGDYEWTAYDEENDGEIDYYALLKVYFEKNITSPQYQYMNIVVPAAYLTTDAKGNVTGINSEANIKGYPLQPPLSFS